LTRKAPRYKYSTLIGDDRTTDSTGPDSEMRGKREVGCTKLISQKGQNVYEPITEKLIEINPIAKFCSIIYATFFCRAICYYKNFTNSIYQFPFARAKLNSISSLQVQLDQAETDRSFLPSTIWISSTIFREKNTCGLAIHFYTELRNYSNIRSFSRQIRVMQGRTNSWRQVAMARICTVKSNIF
jgi:hypothetical protein